MGGTGTLKAVLFDRDGTLVVDVPYNGDPQLVRPMESAHLALARVRRAGLATGVLSNQSGIARGLLTFDQVLAVNQRVDELLGPFDVWEICPHGQADGCTCRKPAPGMILAACSTLGLHPSQVAFVGDIGADVEAATAAGSQAVLVPTHVTRADEIEAAGVVAENLLTAVELLLDAATTGTTGTTATTATTATGGASPKPDARQDAPV
ncbi:D-glycero-alpha-D-manno-heptose-1,7-bisphosphate 7-phosphatase [Paenarthrobacter sp. RAF54_2]|uniref:D-glycero-alpha-D-manno-heptose-1,7-bisphosphate 7-phosphatase n=1 Tax=Paenarthrobacter sp. RAF54_2 TaxID=3233061 RepID=UPI003F94EAE6